MPRKYKPTLDWTCSRCGEPVEVWDTNKRQSALIHSDDQGGPADDDCTRYANED